MQARYLADLTTRFDAPVLPAPPLPQQVKGLKLLEELGEELYGVGVTMGSEQ
jgi:hypothetical protein